MIAGTLGSRPDHRCGNVSLLAPAQVAHRDWIRLPVRFKPCGAAISNDGQWIYAGDYNGELCWISAETGRHCFRLPGGSPMWDITAFPGTDRAMVAHGPGVYGASLIDMERGMAIAHYALRSVTHACPIAPGEWLMIDPVGLSYTVQEATGVVKTAYGFWSNSGMPAEPRDEGSLGFAEDGSYVLIPAKAQRRGDTAPDSTPLWVSYDLRSRVYVEIVPLTEVASPEAILALQKLKPDKRGRKPEADIVLSAFPWSTRKWALGDGAGLALAGVTGTVPIVHVRVGGGGGAGGRVTTVRF